MPPSETTLKQYASRMSLLKNVGVTDPVGDPASVFKYFEKTKQGNSSQKLYLSAIKNAFPDTFPQVFQDKINELYGKQNEKAKDQKLTPAQETNYVEWKDILAVQKKLADKADKTDAEWKQYLVASLYTLNAPVRADYGDMKVVFRYNKKGKGNQLIWKKNPEFVFKDYKTAKTYGEVRIPVSKELKKAIEAWFLHLGEIPKVLLGEEMTASYFASYVQQVFKKYTGKDVGVSLLRHSFITYKYPLLDTIKEKEAVARTMLHSAYTNETYRRIEEDD